MSKVILKSTFISVSILVTLFLYQNCGSGFESIEVLENDSSIQEISNVEEALPLAPVPQLQEQNEEVVPPLEPLNPVEQPEESMVVPEKPEEVVAQVELCNDKEKAFIANDSDTIIIEAENTQMVGKWVKKPGINGSTGSGIIVYQRSGSPNDRNHSYDGISELSYTVYVKEAGVYNFSYRGARYKGVFNYTVFGSHDNNNCPPSKNNCTHSDLNNDAFVSTSNGLAPTKLFAGVGSSTDSWKIASTFDKNHNKSKATVSLKAGFNKIFIRGRSTFFAIDKIFIFKGSQPSQTANQTEVGCP